MSRYAQLGLFAIVAVLLLAAVSYFMTSFGPRGGYSMAVHFPAVGGLAPGSQVFMNGVIVGSAERLEILPDNSVDVVLAVQRDIDIPKDSTFSIRPALTGSPTLAITAPSPPLTAKLTPIPPAQSAVWDKRILPLAQQPIGSPPLAPEDLMAQTGALMARSQAVLGGLRAGKSSVAMLVRARSNLTATQLQMRSALGGIQGSLHSSMVQAQTEMRLSKERLYRHDGTRLAALASSMKQTSQSLRGTLDAARGAFGDPRLKSNMRQTAQQVQRVSASMLAASADLKNIAQNSQTRADLIDAGANLRAALQRLQSLLGGI